MQFKTRGFSNSVSDLLESVNKAKQDAYETVSGEDMLARVEHYNAEADKIKNEGREKLKKKMHCKGDAHGNRGLEILAGCERLWALKSKQARGGECDDDDKGLDCEVRCKDDKDDQIMKFRMHQYE